MCARRRTASAMTEAGGFRLLPCAVCLAMLISSTWPIYAQAPADSPLSAVAGDEKPSNPSDSSAVPVELSGVPGIKAGMTPDDWVTLANQAVQDKQWGMAEKLLVEVIRRRNSDLNALSTLAFVYERHAADKRADASDPNAQRLADQMVGEAVNTYLFAAPVARLSGNPRMAERMYEQVLRYQPNNPPALLGLARVLAETGRGITAIERYKQYVKTPAGQRDVNGYLELGRLHRIANYPRQAISSLQAAAAIDPENAAVQGELALSFLDNKEYDKALSAIDKAVLRDPRSPEYRNYQAGILLAIKKPREAADVGRAAIDLTQERLRNSPTDLKLLEGILVYYRTYETALKDVLASDPGNVAVRIDLARASAAQADINRTLGYSRAISVLVTAPEGDRNNAALLEALAEIRLHGGFHKEAAATARRLLEINPNSLAGRQVLEALPAEFREAPASSPAAP